jgi:hypothetical protein
MPFGQQFFVLTADLKERIKQREKLKAADFTILSSSFTSHSEGGLIALKNSMDAFPKEFVRNLVCLRPDRLIEHEILAQLQARIKLDKSVDDEADTFGRAFTLVQKALKLDDIEKGGVEIYEKNQKEVEGFFDDLIKGKSVESYSFPTKDSETLILFYKELAEKDPWRSNKDLLKSVCFQRGMVLIYTHRAQEFIEPFVVSAINQLCVDEDLEGLDLVDKNDGVAIFTTGGVASGKGTCLTNIAETLETRTPKAIPWNELVHHNADRLKPFLQNPALDPKKYSQYTYEEALLVKERVMHVIAKQGKESGKYPHFLHDQTKLKADELREANQRSGEIIITAISTEVSSSIEWAHGRGTKTGRYEHTEGLLGSHQAVPGEMIKALTQDELIGKGKITVTMYDNNSADRELSIFASINMQTKEIVVYDELQMQNWIKKEKINPKADPKGELYFEKPTRKTADYFAPLIDKGFILKYELTDELDHDEDSALTL